VLKSTDDTSRIPNSSVPGLSESLLAKNISTEYSRIVTSLAVNCVRCNRSTARAALDVEQDRLRDYERNELERITNERQQMNMALPERVATERNSQRYLKRLRKTTENTIARLDRRELAEREWQYLISEPTELTSEFREESNYRMAIKQNEKGKANDAKTRQRRLWKEAYLLAMI
jgi:hypothetical protein